MSRDETADEILEFRAEAASARKLAATFNNGPTVTDLLNYAATLDREAAQLESVFLGAAWSLSSRTMRVEIAAHTVGCSAIHQAEIPLGRRPKKDFEALPRGLRGTAWP
jgi:hypothetical protein